MGRMIAQGDVFESLGTKLRRHATLASSALPAVMSTPLTPTFGANVTGSPAGSYNTARQIATGVRTAAALTGSPILVGGGLLATAGGGVGLSVNNSWSGASFRQDVLWYEFLFFAGADAKFEVHIPSNGEKVDLLVDGQRAWARGSKSASTGGNSHTMLIDLGAVRETPYHVRVDMNGGAVYGVGTRPENAILPVPQHDRLNIITDGDSWWGPGTAATWPGMGCADILARLLSPNPSNGHFGIGGTGHIAAGSYLNYGARHPFDVHLMPPPDVFVEQVSTNDAAADVTALQAAVAADIAALRALAGWSRVPMVYLGIQPNIGGAAYPSTRSAAAKAAVDAARAAGDDRVFFIDASSWVTGTGKNTAPTGNGIADWFWDGTASVNHPTNQGMGFWASQAAQAIKTQVYPLIA